MLLTGYTKTMSRPKCNPSFETLNCIAHLDQDVGEVLPYLNAALGGIQYFNDPPEVVFDYHGKRIKVGAREIAINAVKDEEEAHRILEWLKNEINKTWENRSSITPSYKGKSRPQLFEILKLLPRTNCKKCGLPTCMVFASQMVEGGRSVDQCPELSKENQIKLSNYLAKFDLE